MLAEQSYVSINTANSSMNQKPPPKDSISMIVPYPFVPPRSGGSRVCAQLAISLSRVVNTYVLSTTQPKRTSLFEVTEAIPSSRLKYINPFLSLRISKWLLSHKSRVCLLHHIFLFIPVYLSCRFHNIKLIVKWSDTSGHRVKT